MNAPEHIAPPSNASAVALLPIAEIVHSLSNPRRHFDGDYLAELAESIKAHGVIQPITVRPISLERMFEYNRRRQPGDDNYPQYEIVVGECRWRAAKLAGLTEIPGFWRELNDKQVLEIQVVENLQRRDVHPIEEAEGYQALIARHGYNADQLAAKVGKSRSYIYGRLKFIALCPDARTEFFSNKLDASVALLIARIPGEALQKKATKEVINGYNGEPLSFRAAKQHIHSRYTLSLKQATFAPDDAALVPAAGACSSCPKLSGNFHDLFNDIEAADVCTDPDCFEAKRLARREQLIANAEKKKIPVFLGDKGREAINAEIEYVSLDAEVDDDAEGRTYRQILGDKAPVTALIDFPYGRRDLTECAPLNTLEAALRKAGWKPAEEAPINTQGMTQEQKAEAEAAQARRAEEARQREERKAKADAEQEARRAALDAATIRLHNRTLDTDAFTEDLLYLLAEAWFRQQLDCNELADLEDGIRKHLDDDYALPDEFDDADEIPRAVAILRKAPLACVVAMILADLVRSDECHIHSFNLIDADWRRNCPPNILAPLTRLLGVPFTSITHPALTPSKAAHAGDVGAAAEAPAKGKKPAAKKGKEKADPAPASPANEAAAPPKTGARDPWPFPVQRA